MMNAAVSSYLSARSATQPMPGQSALLPQSLGAGAEEFARVLAQADASAQAAMTGTGDTTALVQSVAQAQFAIETAVAVRDKVVEAYQEILRMPV